MSTFKINRGIVDLLESALESARLTRCGLDPATQELMRLYLDSWVAGPLAEALTKITGEPRTARSRPRSSAAHSGSRKSANMSIKPFSPEAGRYCYYVDEDCLIPGEGYNPRVVFENIAGYIETGANGTQPYRWGRQENGTFSLESAEAHCAKVNRDLGLSKKDVAVIVARSMRG